MLESRGDLHWTVSGENSDHIGHKLISDGATQGCRAHRSAAEGKAHVHTPATVNGGEAEERRGGVKMEDLGFLNRWLVCTLAVDSFISQPRIPPATSEKTTQTDR